MKPDKTPREYLRLWLALTRVPFLGPVLGRRLLNHFGSPDRIFGANFSELTSVKDIGKRTAESVLKGPDFKFADEQIEIMESKDIHAVTYHDDVYPSRLKQIYDPPLVVFCRGQLLGSDERAIGIVGSRKATHYGKQMAETISSELCRAGITVVSGFARGIDSVSHRAAIDSNGRTIAVFGCGVDCIYPPENKSMYRDLPEHGVLMSEFPCGTIPDGSNFPRRNRIISGLSLGVVVIEAGRKSGALLTAKHALEQNREVFALPGNVTSPSSAGTNDLIRQGAHLIGSTEDILRELEFIIPKYSDNTPETLPSIDLSPELEKLYGVIPNEPIHLDVISRESGVEVRTLLGQLLELELKGVVQQVSGKRFVKSNAKLYNG